MVDPSPIVLSGRLMIPDSPGTVRLVEGFLAILGDRIEHVEIGRPHPSPTFGGEGFIITPGFVDTHLHLPQFDSIGLDGMELLDWLNNAIFPAEQLWADADYAAAMTRRVAAELHSFGTTAVGAYATSHPQSAQAAINEMADAGFAGHIGLVLMDRHAPADLLLPASAALSAAAGLRPRARIAPAVTPRFAVACSQALLEGAGRLAATTGCLIQTHLAETLRECELVRDLHAGLSYTEVYRRAGLLTPRTILGHGIWLDDADRCLLRDAGAVLAHCPAANRFLDAGVMNRAAAIDAGLRISLGTDVGAGPDRGMVRVARAAIDAAKQARAPAVPSAGEMFHQITEGNARALGLPHTGCIGRGMVADLLLIRPTTAWTSSPDPLSTLLYTWDDRWLHRTFAAGRTVYRAAFEPNAPPAAPSDHIMTP